MKRCAMSRREALRRPQDRLVAGGGPPGPRFARQTHHAPDGARANGLLERSHPIRLCEGIPAGVTMAGSRPIGAEHLAIDFIYPHLCITSRASRWATATPSRRAARAPAPVTVRRTHSGKYGEHDRRVISVEAVLALPVCPDLHWRTSRIGRFSMSFWLRN